MVLRLRVPAVNVAAVLRRGGTAGAAAPCACPVVLLASRTPAEAALRRGFATRRAAHVKFSDKKKKVPIILLQDCDLGRGGDEVHVSPGYMRNYLYERRVAVYSTPENKRKHHVPRTMQDRAEFLRPARVAAALSSTPLVRWRRALLAMRLRQLRHDSLALQPLRALRSCTATLSPGSSGQRAR